MGPHIATLPRHRDTASSRRGRDLRRVGIVLLCLLVAAALVGALGPRAGVATASGGGYELTVRHGQVTRPGIPVPLELTVERPGGFDGPVTVTLSAGLLDRLDFNSWHPAPDGETVRADRLEYEFARPAGDALHVLLDARTAPGQPPSSQRYVVAVVDGDDVLAEATFRMTVLP